jgi:Protein of unknown function (DUF2950)
MLNNIRRVLLPDVGMRLMTFLLLAMTVLPATGYAAGADAAQRRFDSPEEARQALVAAVQAKDQLTLRAIFGPVAAELESSDPVERTAELERFSMHIQEGAELVMESGTRATILIGAKKWPFPVPLVKKGNDWLFDTEAGREEILNRRIGRNELNAVKVCKAYVDAQREYYAKPEQEGDQIPKYAQRKFSKPGKKDGLYWPTAPGEKVSPLGPLVANAQDEGYMKQRMPGEKGPRPFHGYFFRILKRQGPNAPGGEFNYVINGNMVAGFALIAYPAKWGVTGVTTFIVNQRGRVYEKNFGSNTLELARKIKSYNPDLTWKLME